MERNELDKIIEMHRHWLCKDREGWESMRADLQGADLRGADLRGAYLQRAKLQGADLWGADLQGADLQRANLQGADIHEAKGTYMACPTEGEFIGWKKALFEDKSVIVKLKIPADARRSSATTEKCRCDKAEVIGIWLINGYADDLTEQVDTAISSHDNNFIYQVGETVSVDDFDDNRFNECSTGIHFFLDKRAAMEY